MKTAVLTRHHTTTRAVTETFTVYERDARLFLQRWGQGRYRRPPLLREWLTWIPGRGRLLDLGCGAGQDARHLQALGHRVVGLDRSWALLRFARTCRPSIPLAFADMRNLPFSPASFDGIWAAASLMHLPKKEACHVLVGLRHLTKPEGVLAATVTHGTKSRIRKHGWLPGRYFARWKKDELSRALRRAGWDVLRVQVVHNQERKGRWINVVAQSPAGLGRPRSRL